jgi:anthranilate synthase
LVTPPESHLFKNLPQSFEVGRYHSLFALPERLPEELKVTALSDDGVIMAVEHKTLPIAAVQFHPESIMTLAGEVGLAIIRNAITSYAKPGSSSNKLQDEITINSELNYLKV